jgi:hypothetical protein
MRIPALVPSHREVLRQMLVASLIARAVRRKPGDASMRGKVARG